jgi:release factor glutamine methyltransferase
VTPGNSTSSVLTVSEMLDWAFHVLKAADVESPRSDAEIIICSLLSRDRASVYAEPSRKVDEDTVRRIKEAVARRSAREPVQYVVGQTQFLDHRLRVKPGVLIPRPETELLALEVIDFLSETLERRPPWGPVEPLAADIGTGAGPLAVAMASALPRLTVYATDVSPAALGLAGENASAAGVADRVVLLQGQMVAPLKEKSLDGKLAAVVCNPPYVSDSQWSLLPEEVRDHEPREALLAGPQGLDRIEELIEEAPYMLAPRGLLAFEMGAWQWPKVVKLLERQMLLGSFRVIRDLAGFERIATAVRI